MAILSKAQHFNTYVRVVRAIVVMGFLAASTACAAPLLMTTLTHGTPYDGNVLPPREIWVGRLDMDTLTLASETHPDCKAWLPLTSCYLSGQIVGDLRGHRVFVSVFGDDTRAPAATSLSAGGVLAIDTITDSVVGGVMANSGVRSMFVDPLRRRLFIQNGDYGETLTVVDTRSLNTIGTLSLTSAAFIDGIRHVVFDPNRQRAYAVGMTPLPTLFAIDTATMRVISTSPTYIDFSWLLLSADGNTLYAVGSQTVAAIDIATGSTAATASLAGPQIALDSVRNALYVPRVDPPVPPAPYGSPKVDVLDAHTLETVRTLPGLDIYFGLAVREADGALLALGSTSDPDGNCCPLLAINPVSGAILASNITGRGLLPRLDGAQFFRVQAGVVDPGLSVGFSYYSQGIIVLDSFSLNPVGSVVLDTRAASDPSRQTTSINTTGLLSMPKVTLGVEYFHSGLGHYFITSLAAEIAALDSGVFPGWQRTGETLSLYARRDDAPDGVVPVCRFYGLPQAGLNSHFYSASATECAAVQQKYPNAWLLESDEVFDVYPAYVATGACLFDTTPVYRVYNNRPDANHRYTTSLAIRDSMVAAGWIAEGYGPDAVAFCAPR